MNSASRHTRLGVAAILAIVFSAFLGVPQSVAKSNHQSPKPGQTVVALRTMPMRVIDLPSIATLTGEVSSELKLAHLVAARAKSDVGVYLRARLVRISRNFARPTSDYRLTAGFGARSRLWGTMHTGQDFAAPWGTRVKAAESGTVVFAGWDGGYGRKIAIAHIDGIQTWYGHLSSINVRVGQHVTVGQFIGRVGMTGNATGPHLHFEVRRYGVPINPVIWLRSVGIWV